MDNNRVYVSGSAPVRRSDRSRWHWLLLVPIVLSLLTPLYNRIEPTLWDFPFFYWFQLALVVLGGAVTGLVHLLTRRGR